MESGPKPAFLYCGDNLPFMQSLESDTFNLIYSDILYGTGRKFKDYIDLKPIRTEIENHYIPRLSEMKRLLTENGNIYIQMDYRINHWIRCIMDDIFGYDNFRNEIIWHYNSAPRKNRCFGNRHDTIFRYSKSDDFYFNEDAVRVPYSATAPRGYDKEKYYNPNGKVMDDVWKINSISQNDKTERCGYATQKPLELLERIVQSSCPKGGLVGDFYMGSGTTAVACKKHGMEFIGCDINSNSISITQKRINDLIL